MSTKNLTKGAIIIICLLLFFQPNSSFGQWHRADLPGISSYSELLTILIVMGSGGVIMLIIPGPKPELYIKRSDLINKDNSFAPRHKQAVERLRNFSKACMVLQKSPKRTVFGTIRSVDDKRFVVETRLDSVEVPYTRLKEIYDLAGAAKLYKNGRWRLGIFMTGLAASFFYEGVISDHPFEGGERALSWTTFSGFGALAAYCFLDKTDAEKEYKIWQSDYTALSKPSKAPNSQWSTRRRSLSSGIGFKLGLNFAKISGKNVKDINYKTGIVGGGSFLYKLHNISSSLAIQPEVLFSMKGYKLQIQSFRGPLDASVTLTYLEIPVLAKVSIPKQYSFTPSLLAGPALAVKLNSSAELDGKAWEVTTDVETIDWGMILGVGGQLNKSPFSFEIRYNLGFKSCFENGDAKNRAFSIMLGYSL